MIKENAYKKGGLLRLHFLKGDLMIKKILSSVICLFLACTSLSSLNEVTVTVHGNNQQVEIVEQGDTITISNDYISRSFKNTGGSLTTSQIDNKVIGEVLYPQTGSNDFVINTISENEPELKNPSQSIDLQDASITFDGNDAKANSIDGNPATTIAGFVDQELIIDLQESQTVQAFSYLKRPGYIDANYGLNGTLGAYEVYASQDGVDYSLVHEGAFQAQDYNLKSSVVPVGETWYGDGQSYPEGTTIHNIGDVVYAVFDAPIQARYIKLIPKTTALGSATTEFQMAEIALFSDGFSSLHIPVNVVEATSVSLDGNEVKGSIQDGNPATTAAANVGDGVIFDLGSEQAVSSFSYEKRPPYILQAYGINGTMGNYEIYVSHDASDWTAAGSGSFEGSDYNLKSVVVPNGETWYGDGQTYPEGTTLYNHGDVVYANLDTTYTARYVKIVPMSDVLGSTNEFQVAEMYVYADAYNSGEAEEVSTTIRSSELVYTNYETSQGSEGEQILTLHYADYEVYGVTYSIVQKVVLHADDHYMRNFIEITVDNQVDARIDYIDTNSFVLASDASDVWSIPDISEVSSMWIGAYELMLGQPIYVDGLFMGSEFPATATDVEKNTTRVRYYSGKNFEELQRDGQLTSDGKYVSWQNVIGSANGTQTSVVQTAFFEYIQEIATPTEFRKQYNSWYDNMMNISADSIAESFLGSEAGLSAEGVEPLDAYVVDDGWNNYYDGEHLATPGSSQGTEENQTGFWEFNNKFPNELYTSTELTSKLQSTFGVWVGPQGGYNYFGQFSRFLEEQGTGFVQHNSVLGDVLCTGSQVYLDNYTSLFLDYQQRFDIEYWKWDGFASRPCNEEGHGHMVGGYNNMYYTSDMWEKWIVVFDTFREDNPEVFINATCYVNLSPWLLQWVNTVWIQDSGDTGEIQGDGSRFERKIYYRDKVYYQLFEQNEIQFPLKNLYNHDPIYGVSDGSDATTEDFREFVFANAVRGTAFWELYYSPSIMDEEKWKVNADVLAWTEANIDVLENAKLFGARADLGVYGYSSWKGEEGVLSFTNPLGSAQTYTIVLDEAIGVPSSLQGAQGVQIEPYVVGHLDNTFTYGQTLEVHLQANETIIYHINEVDIQAPMIDSIANTDNTTIRVKFNERVNPNALFKVDGVEVDSTLLADYRTYELSLTQPITTGEVDIEIGEVSDAYGNAFISDIETVDVYAENVIASIEEHEDMTLDLVSGNHTLALDQNQIVVSESGIVGDEVFSIALSVDTTSVNSTIVQQGDAIKVYIDAEGFVHAQVGDLNVSSRQEVTSVTQKATGTFATSEYVPTQTQTQVVGQVNDDNLHSIIVVREMNNVLKLYVDGQLANTAYNDANRIDIVEDSIVIGSDTFEGQIASFDVFNKVVDYVEAKGIAEDTIPSTMREVERSTWSASASSEMSGMSGDASAMAAIDGNAASWWHNNYVDASAPTPHWIAIHFHEEVQASQVQYTARGANGDWQTIDVYAEDEDGQYTQIMDDYVVNGSFITLPENTSAYGFKFELVSSVGGFGSAVEIQVFEEDQQVDNAYVSSVVNPLLEAFEAIDENGYTKDSYEAYESAIADIESILEVSKTDTISMFVLDKFVQNVHESVSKLVEVLEPADYAALQIVLASAQSLHPDQYVDFSTVQSAIDAVVFGLNATKQDEVDAMTQTLVDAMESLQLKDADYTQLLTLVAEVQLLQEDVYTNYEVVKQALDAIDYTLNIQQQAQVDSMYDALFDAKKGLIYKDADYSAIDEMLEKVNVLTRYMYLSLDSLDSALLQIERDKNITQQADVDSMFMQLQSAYDALVMKTILHEVEGANQVITTLEKPATFTIDEQSLDALQAVYVNGVLLDRNAYTKTSGSIIVSLLPEYLKGLTNDAYTIDFVTQDSVYATTFSIQVDTSVSVPSTPEATTPPTGDTTNVFMYMMLLLVSGWAMRRCVSNK